MGIATFRQCSFWISTKCRSGRNERMTEFVSFQTQLHPTEVVQQP